MVNFDELNQQGASDIITQIKGGQPPDPNHIPFLRVGRHDEEETLCDDPVAGLQSVRNSNGDMFFVLGNFGFGKTFFINLIERRAQQMDFITVEKRIGDIQNISDEVEFYRDIVEKLEYPDKRGSGLAPLLSQFANEASTDDLDAIADRRRMTGHQITRILRRVLKAEEQGSVYVDQDDETLKYREVLEAAVEYLSGGNPGLSARHAIGVSGYDWARVGREDQQWTYFKHIRSIALELGYSGILVSVDEAGPGEEMDWSPDSATKDTLIDLFNKCFSSDFDNIMFIFVGNQERWDTLIDRIGHQALDDRYHAKRLPLGSLTRSDYHGLVEKTARLTEIAYDMTINLSDDDIEEIVEHAIGVHGELNELSPRGLLMYPRDTTDESPDLVDYMREEYSI